MKGIYYSKVLVREMKNAKTRGNLLLQSLSTRTAHRGNGRVFITDLLSAIEGNLAKERQPFFNIDILICFDSLT